YRTAFILQGDSEKEQIVNTGNSWKVLKDESYQALKPDLIHTYYVAGPGEKIDFNKSPNDWQSAAYDDSNWESATQLFHGLPKGVFYWSDGWMLVPRSIPQMELKEERLKSVVNIDMDASQTFSDRFFQTDEITTSKFPKKETYFNVFSRKKVIILFDQGFLTNAYPVLKFSKGKNAKITLSYAEALYVDEGKEKDWKTQNQKGDRQSILNKRFVGVKDEIVSGGTDNQLFITLMFRTYRYLQLTIETYDEGLIIEDLHGIFTGYPFEKKAKFDAKNPRLDKILEVGWRTARLCAYETYVDCPYYEQLQYAGDTRIQALVSLFNSGDDRLVRQAINQLDNSRLAEGITLSRFPTTNSQQIPPFSLGWIGMIHDFRQYRDDTVFVKSKLPGIRQVINWFQKFQQSDGTLKRVSYWNFTDWADYGKGWDRGVAPSGADGRSSTLDLQLLWAYQLTAALENDLGIKELAKSYEAEAQKLKTAIKNIYWDENRQLFAETSDKTTFSQHTNTLAILTGMLSKQEAKILADKLLTDKTLVQATIYFKYYVHQAITKAGLGDKYLELLTDGKTNWQTA
ncbi:MAG: alpha-rhamnosidase, partial [Verrucomicrobia bacterium]|nr:alpha-rhamnosidase [Cytophagales bacterium]